MSKKELIKRYAVLVFGLFFAAFGVAVTKQGDLGISPVSSVPNVLGYKFPVLSLGNWLIVWNCMLILAQVLILRKSFKPFQLLQIPVSFLFGYFTDFGRWCISSVPTDMYIVQLILTLSGTALLGLGISLSVIADVIMNPGEAVVKTVANVTGKKFSTVKIILDVSYVLFSIVLSMLFFDFKIVGTREGTIIAALFTGVFVKWFSALLTKPVTELIRK